MVAQCTETPGQFWVIRCDHTTFTSSNGFARMKTEATHHPPGARLTTVPSSGQGTGGILDYRHRIVVGQLKDGWHVRHLPESVHWEDRFHPLCRSRDRHESLQGPLKAGRIYIESIRLNVYKDRLRAAQLNNIRGGQPGVCRHQHNIARAYIEGQQCQVQGRCTITHRDRILATDVLRHSLLKGRDV